MEISSSQFEMISGRLVDMFQHAELVHTERWQGMDISRKPDMATRELPFVSIRYPLYQNTTDPSLYHQSIRPNLPWADRHFEMERVGRQPLNPGETWKEWPYALSADKFRTEGTQFSHSYAERYWPKYAGRTDDGKLGPEDRGVMPHGGIRYPYGDLDDVIGLLRRQPLTRQAILPVWFPEDTGAIVDQRVPCSLAYHFFNRDDKLNIVYYLRSCDFVRHFRDDVYLTIRLLLWVLDELRVSQEHGYWYDVKPGTLVMHITSLHMFVNDWNQRYRK